MKITEVAFALLVVVRITGLIPGYEITGVRYRVLGYSIETPRTANPVKTGPTVTHRRPHSSSTPVSVRVIPYTSMPMRARGKHTASVSAFFHSSHRPDGHVHPASVLGDENRNVLVFLRSGPVSSSSPGSTPSRVGSNLGSPVAHPTVTQ